MNAKTWVDILFIYGPFAILIFLVFVVERRIYSRWRGANRSDKKEQTAFLGLYASTWLMIFGVAVYSIYAWKKVNLDERPRIAGEIQNLSNLETLGTSSADLYLNKIPGSGRFSDYRVLLVKSDNKRWRPDEPVRLTIQTPGRPGNQDGDLFEYFLYIRPDFYENGVTLTRREDKLEFYDAGKWTPLDGRKVLRGADPTVPEPAPQSRNIWDIIPTAYAHAYQDYQQMKQSPPIEDFAVGLESPDAVVRRKSRADLAKQNPIVAVPWIENVLDDPKSSYRLKLGVLVALNQMPGVNAEGLRPSTIAVVQTMLCDSDDTLRNEAYSFLQKLKLMPVVLYEHADFTGKSQGFGPCKYRADKGQFWKIPNDSASSIKVAKGYSAKVCEHEGPQGTGVRCETYREGTQNLTMLSDRVSFVEVTKYDPPQQRSMRRR